MIAPCSASWRCARWGAMLVAAAKDPLAVHWALLDNHFKHHANLVHRFRSADRAAVLRMWWTQTNEQGNPLSEFEREALIERHCELFGMWPR